MGPLNNNTQQSREDMLSSEVNPQKRPNTMLRILTQGQQKSEQVYPFVDVHSQCWVILWEKVSMGTAAVFTDSNLEPKQFRNNF